MSGTAKAVADNFLYDSTTTKKHDIPLSHLDYEYIGKCTNTKELEKILRILRSGEEGRFPDLERTCEEKIRSLNPNSRVLRKDNPIMKATDLDREEWQQINKDLQGWQTNIRSTDAEINQTDTLTNDDDDEDLPPIRSCTSINIEGKQETTKTKPDVSNKRVKPRDYREWDKFDIEKELESVDKQAVEKKQTVKSSGKPTDIKDYIEAKGLTDEEKQFKANREKDKGNEAFRAGDYEEAVAYYSRSISLLPTAASYNNRALAYLKVSKWDKALKDCDMVLKLEPDNIKALLRRGSANKGKKEFNKAQIDFERVLELEPSNKRARELLEELQKETEKAESERKQRKEKGRRMVIEEVEGSDEEEEIEVEKPSPPRQTKGEKLTNGVSEKSENIKEFNKSTTKPVINGHISENDKVCSQKTKDIWESDEVDEKSDSVISANQKTYKEMDKVIDSDTVTNQNADTATESSNQTNLCDLSDGKTSVQEEKENEQNEKLEQLKVTTDNQFSDETVDQTGEKEEGSSPVVDETVSLRRPVFYQNELPSDVSSLREGGNNLFRTGQYGDAINKYTLAIVKLEKVKSEQVVNLSLLYSNRAACHLKTGDCPAAVRDCTTALELVPHSIKPLLRRASAYEHLERYRMAYVDYKHVLHVDRFVDMANQGSSRCQGHLQQDDGPSWRDKLPPITRVSPWEVPEIIDNAGAPVKSNPVTVTTQSTKQAESVVTKETPVTIATKSPEPAVVKEEIKKPKISPEEVFDLKKGDGNKCVQQGDFRKAATLYTECIDLFPERTVSYTNRALCYLRLDQASDAEKDCSKALDLEPENVKALFRRGQARKMLKKYKESLEDLTHLLKVDPKNTAAKKELDLVKNYYREALNSLKKQMPNNTGSTTKSTAPSTKSDPPKKETKQRKRMVIQEVESDSEEEVKVEKETTKSKAKDTAEARTKKDKPNSTTQNSKTNKKTGAHKSAATTVKPTSTGLPVAPPSVPKLDKATPYEFIQAWNSLKLAKDVQPYADLLRQISPEDIPTVISNKLDGQMLNTITKCVAQKFVGEGDTDTGYRILANLCKVPRFQTIAMFLSNNDKKDIQTVFQRLQQTKSDNYSEADLINLKKEYGIK